jgi:hypothetical protein
VATTTSVSNSSHVMSINVAQTWEKSAIRGNTPKKMTMTTANDRTTRTVRSLGSRVDDEDFSPTPSRVPANGDQGSALGGRELVSIQNIRKFSATFLLFLFRRRAGDARPEISEIALVIVDERPDSDADDDRHD